MYIDNTFICTLSALIRTFAWRNMVSVEEKNSSLEIFFHILQHVKLIIPTCLNLTCSTPNLSNMIITHSITSLHSCWYGKVIARTSTKYTFTFNYLSFGHTILDACGYIKWWKYCGSNVDTILCAECLRISKYTVITQNIYPLSIKHKIIIHHCIVCLFV